MSATIYVHEFRSRLKSVVIWSLSIAALIILFLSIFTGFAQDAALIDAMMSKFPETFRDAFGLGNLNLSSTLGYFGFLFIFVQLCLAIQASNYGFGLVSIEESEMTADFLLSKPVSRVQIMGSKLLAAFTSLTITNLVIWAATFISLALFTGSQAYDTGRLILLLSSIVLFQLFFMAVGLVISLLVRRVRSVTPWALSLGFGMYVLNAFSGVFADVKLEYLTAFKHLDPSYIINNGAYNTPLLLLNVGVTIASLVVSFWLYIRRDIPMVS